MGSLELQRQVAQAVHILNHDTQSCNRVAANQWLVQFQHTDAAWEVATTILATDTAHTIDFEVELFAAQVLKRKVCVLIFVYGLQKATFPLYFPIVVMTYFGPVYHLQSVTATRVTLSFHWCTMMVKLTF